MAEIKKVLAFDIGGTKIAYAVVDAAGNICGDVVKNATPATKEAVYVFLKSIIQTYEAEVDAIAVSTAGTVDKKNTRVTAPVGNMPDGYETTDFQSLCSKKVYVENDANAAVWAEYKVGNAQGKDNIVMLTLGTGVGVGIIIDGRLLTGKNGAAGEVHFPIRQDKKRRCKCGRYDCLEIHMSGRALNLDAKEFYKDDNATSYDVIAGLKENKPQAVEAFNHWQNMVKDGVVIFADIFDPDIILLGGSMAHFIDYDKVGKEANAEIVTTPFELKEAAFENNAGIIGAALRCVESDKTCSVI